MVPIILCGGSGSRLWPLSRSAYPKQFLKILGNHSLLQETIARLPFSSGVVASQGYVIANQEHRFLVAEQIQQIGHTGLQMVLEPTGKNTAAAVATAAVLVASKNPQDVLVVLSADHVIHDAAAFEAALSVAKQAAQAGQVVTFGIQPTHPETGYGYIHADLSNVQSVYPVKSFVEKPDAATASQYLASGDYFWNSGMFVFRADVMLEELARYAPDILSSVQQAIDTSRQEHDFLWLDAVPFAQCREQSIDYAVMEKTQLAQVVPFAGGWNDVGSWSAVWDESPKDTQGNGLSGDVVVQEVRDSYIHAESRLVGAVDVENLVIVETSDAVLVTSRQSAQKVKTLVEHLKLHARQEGNQHQLVHRPWGSYESLGQGPHHQVKRLIIKPGAGISVQYHHQRSEHWVVIAGTATVRLGEQYLSLSQNQSIFIPVGVVHALENPGTENLEIIEVQSGSYLGEDDIVRLEDRYGRV